MNLKTQICPESRLHLRDRNRAKYRAYIFMGKFWSQLGREALILESKLVIAMTYLNHPKNISE
jgi:hypothetical protein